jgi:hypothetical protein
MCIQHVNDLGAEARRPTTDRQPATDDRPTTDRPTDDRRPTTDRPTTGDGQPKADDRRRTADGPTDRRTDGPTDRRTDGRNMHIQRSMAGGLIGRTSFADAPLAGTVPRRPCNAPARLDRAL